MTFKEWLQNRPYTVLFTGDFFEIPGALKGSISDQCVSMTAADGGSINTDLMRMATIFVESAEQLIKPDPSKDLVWIANMLTKRGLPAIWQGKAIHFDCKGLRGRAQPKLRVEELCPGWFLAKRSFAQGSKPEGGRLDAEKALEFMTESWKLLQAQNETLKIRAQAEKDAEALAKKNLIRLRVILGTVDGAVGGVKVESAVGATHMRLSFNGPVDEVLALLKA